MATDLLSFVEAAYDLDAQPTEWLTQLVRPLGDLFDDHLGMVAHSFDARDGGQVKLADHVFVEAPRAVRDDFWEWVSTHGSVEAAGYKDVPTRCALASEVIPAMRERFEARGGPVGDVFGLVASCYDGTGWMLMVALPRSRRLSQRQRWIWMRAAAHVAASGRLRRVLHQTDEEAILAPDGKVHHAVGAAKSPSARERLRRAVRAIDRARSREVSDSDEALELWRGLVEGRWTLLDRFDSDGRRYFVARPNAPQFPDPRGLSTRERQVSQLAARGAANKLIAYELGLSPSSVATHLRQAMRKLDAPNRAQLVERVLGI